MREWLWQAAEWWVGTAIGGGLVLLAGCALMRLARPPAVRQRIGEWSILAALIVAGLRLMPAWLPLPWSASPAVAAVDPNGPLPASGCVWFDAPLAATAVEAAQAAQTDEHSVEVIAMAAAPIPPEPTTPAWSWHDLAPWLTGAYLAFATLLCMRWLLGQWALGRLMRQARPAAPRLRRLFTAMAAGTLWPLPRLRLSRRLRAPVCFGIRKPAVLLPEAMDDAEDTKLRWVFAHELTHLRRRDPWSSWGIGLAQAVYFYLPWFWWVRRQVRLCQEYVADAAAAEQGEAADEYAEFLVSLAKLPANPLGATGLGSSSDLLRRVQMLLQTSKSGVGSWPRGRSLLTAAALLAVAVFAGGVGLRAEPPKEEKRDVLILRQLGDEKVADVLRLAPDAVKFVVRLDEESDVKDKKSDKKSDVKIEKKVMIVIDSGDGPVIIPFDGDLKSDDLKKAIEKAKSKAKGEGDAKAKDRAAAVQKALKALDGQLSDDQMKMLKKHLEAIQAHKPEIDAARAEADKARKLAEEMRHSAEAIRKKVTDERGVADVHRKLIDEAHILHGVDAKGQPHVFAVAGGGRFGARVEKPNAALVDQLDLPKDRGLVIVDVVKDSAAAKAGFKANDVILEIADLAVPNDTAAFIKIIGSIKNDDDVNAIVLRKGRKERVKGIKLGDAPKSGVFQWQVAPTGGEQGHFKIQLQPHGDVVIPRQAELELKLELDKTKRDLDLKDDLQKELGKKKRDLELKVDLQKEIDNVRKNLEVQVVPVPPVAPKAPKAVKAPKSDASEKSEQKNRNVSISVNDGKFKAVQKEDDTTIIVAGTINDGKVDVEEIIVTDGGTKKAYKRLADVPEKHRGSVKALISNSDQSPVRFDFKKKIED